MNEQNMKTIFECISLLNKEITHQKSTPASLEVFMKLMQLEIDCCKKKEINNVAN